MYKLIVILAVFTAACAQMLLKKGASLTSVHSPEGEGRARWFIKQYLNPWVIGGYTIMGLVMLVNIWAMSKGVLLKEVGIIESLSYLFVPCLSWMIFGERLSWMKIVAIAIIMCGIVVFFI